MNSLEEYKIWQLISRAEAEWADDYQHWVKLPPMDRLPIDEPNLNDYLTYEIYNYKYGK